MLQHKIRCRRILVIPVARRDSWCVPVLSPECKETGGSSRGVKATQGAMTKRLAVCNSTFTQTKQLKARSPITEILLCVLQTAKETLNKYCKNFEQFGTTLTIQKSTCTMKSRTVYIPRMPLTVRSTTSVFMYAILKHRLL